MRQSGSDQSIEEAGSPTRPGSLVELGRPINEEYLAVVFCLLVAAAEAKGLAVVGGASASLTTIPFLDFESSSTTAQRFSLDLASIHVDAEAVPWLGGSVDRGSRHAGHLMRAHR